MADPILSPDGEYMWTGAEWIPKPPLSPQSAKVDLQDSVIGGDVNITQNNVEDISAAMVQALEKHASMVLNSSTDSKRTSNDELVKILSISNELNQFGHKLDSWTEVALGDAARNGGLNEEALKHYFFALDYFRLNADLFGEATVLKEIGTVYQNISEIHQSEVYFQQSLEMMKRLNNAHGIANVLNNIGVNQVNQEKYTEAELTYNRVLELRIKDNDIPYIAAIKGNLANLYSVQKNHSNAETMYLEIYEMLAKYKTLQDIERDNTLYIAQHYVGDLGKNQHSNKKREIKKIAYMIMRIKNISCHNLAGYFRQRGDFVEAERFLKERLAIMAEIGSRFGEADSLVHLAMLAEDRNDLAEQRRLNIEAVKIWREIGVTVPQWYLDNGY